MAWGLDTDTFVNALARLTSRHGVPKEVISDRGTNFVGAVGEITKLTSQLDRRHIQCKTAELGLTWRFNPPGDSTRYSKRTLALGRIAEVYHTHFHTFIFHILTYLQDIP